jgi:hypothetical protein
MISTEVAFVTSLLNSPAKPTFTSSPSPISSAPVISASEISNFAVLPPSSVPVTFYSYGADEYELGDLVIPAGEDQLLEKTAEAGDRILEDLGLSKDDYRITSLVWNGEPFSDENGQICREALALGKRLLQDYEVLYEGEVKWKEPDYYELHVIYQLEEPAKMTEEETTMEIKEDHTEKNDSPVKRQGPFWYLVRTGLMITVAIGILGLFIGLILLVVMKRRSRKDRS